MRADINGTSIAYDRAGRGPAVVLISGGGTLDRRAWDDQFERFAGSHTVIRYDVRGIGESGRAEAPFSHSDDLHALLRHLRVDAACVVGLSFGAGIAADFALEHPEMVTGLVLAACGLSSDQEKNLRDAQAAADAARTMGLEPIVDSIVANRMVLASASDAVRARVKQI